MNSFAYGLAPHGNVLIALVIQSHEHHARCLNWFYAEERDFATCAVTEGTLLRLHLMKAADRSAVAAWNTLSRLRKMQGHQFWDAGFSYEDVPHQKLSGHRLVTDAWLAELARKRAGKLATMDAGLAAAHPDVADLVQ